MLGRSTQAATVFDDVTGPRVDLRERAPIPKKSLEDPVELFDVRWTKVDGNVQDVKE
jgi:hypothetical protein